MVVEYRNIESFITLMQFKRYVNVWNGIYCVIDTNCSTLFFIHFSYIVCFYYMLLKAHKNLRVCWFAFKYCNIFSVNEYVLSCIYGYKYWAGIFSFHLQSLNFKYRMNFLIDATILFPKYVLRWKNRFGWKLGNLDFCASEIWGNSFHLRCLFNIENYFGFWNFGHYFLFYRFWLHVKITECD